MQLKIDPDLLAIVAGAHGIRTVITTFCDVLEGEETLLFLEVELSDGRFADLVARVSALSLSKCLVQPDSDHQGRHDVMRQEAAEGMRPEGRRGGQT
jgi:hypothetical protein